MILVNFGQIILADNRQILCTTEENYGWNCKVKSDCLMQSKCLTPQVVYEVEVTNSADAKLKINYDLSGTHGGLRQPILIF